VLVGGGEPLDRVVECPRIPDSEEAVTGDQEEPTAPLDDVDVFGWRLAVSRHP
jgi:hypothetical protein